ncbi:hypothetical protein D9M72_493970 [compost metagenome]
MIRLVDRIFHIEHRRNGLGDLFAVFDGHGAVVALGHDLQRQAVLAGHAHAHQAVTHRHDDRLDDVGDALVETGFGDQARFICIFSRCRIGQTIISSSDRLIKKSGS